MQLATGTKLGPYEIVAPLGAGGMGEPVGTGTNFDAGAPVALYQTNSRQPVATSEQVTYDVTKDG
jgi:hypothetical protein